MSVPLPVFPLQQHFIYCKKYFTENIEAWARSFKIRAKIEIQEQLSLRLTSQRSLLLSCVARYTVKFRK